MLEVGHQLRSLCLARGQRGQGDPKYAPSCRAVLEEEQGVTASQPWSGRTGFTGSQLERGWGSLRSAQHTQTSRPGPRLLKMPTSSSNTGTWGALGAARGAGRGRERTRGLPQHPKSALCRAANASEPCSCGHGDGRGEPGRSEEPRARPRFERGCEILRDPAVPGEGSRDEGCQATLIRLFPNLQAGKQPRGPAPAPPGTVPKRQPQRLRPGAGGEKFPKRPGFCQQQQAKCQLAKSPPGKRAL